MQIIDIGICVNNIDPKGVGRVRYRPYSLYQSEISLAFDYEDWDEDDPFIAIPFLPHHINIIPQVGQSIKLVRYHTEKETQNVEYVAGPYSTPHDPQAQTFTNQHKHTTYAGVIVKETKDIRSEEGLYNSPTTPGAVVNDNDTGFRGNYGSDVVFTENGLIIRGGLLKSKGGKNNESLLNYPQLAKKMGRISLKKFASTLEATEEVTPTETIASSRIKYIVEYELNDLTNPTLLKLFVYRVLPGYGEQFNTDVFSADSVFNNKDTDLVKLINTTDTTTDASYVQELDGTISSAYIELRDLLYRIDAEGLTTLDNSYPTDMVYPFYYRPTSSFNLTRGGDPTEVTNKDTFLSNIQVRSRTTPSGLIYSRQSSNPPIIQGEERITVAREVKKGGEQSLSNYSADRIYLTSTSPNVGVNVKKIDFEDLNEYELTQEDYIKRIGPNTYGMVRGENLYNVLISIKNLLDSHIHNINEPLVKTDPNWVKLNELIESLRNDLLNDSIRIN